MIEYISYKTVLNNNFILKTILKYSIEKDSVLFKVLTLIKNNKENIDNAYEICDKNLPFAILKKNDTIIGFIQEQEFIQDAVKSKIMALNIVYILPEYRKKGYCTDFLKEYSNLPRTIIADSTISCLIIKIIKNLNILDLINFPYTPNLDIRNIKKSFVNGDKTLNWNTKALNTLWRNNLL